MKMIRFLKIIHHRQLSKIIVVKRHTSGLTRAVREAEKVVGYSTSFLNLRWLLTDEIANVAQQIRKLVGTNHPLLHTARKLFMGNSIPTWGLIVLLISKAAGLNGIQNDIEKDHTAGVLNTQRAVAEVTEMIRMSYIIHKSIVNIRDSDYIADLNFGNKIALLSGDYLLGNSYHELANIRNHNVTELISGALRDLIESEFIDNKPYKPVTFERVNIENNYSSDPYNCKTAFGNPRAEWIYRSVIGGASLLAKACQSALTLAKHPEHVQQLGYVFGKNVALAWQAQLEREAFVSNTQDSLCLVSAPVMLHLEEDATLFDLINTEEVDYNEIRKRIFNGNGLNMTESLQNEFCGKALDVLNVLPESDAHTALSNIIKTIV